MKIILRADKKRYVLVASAAECSKMLDCGLVIENVHDYGDGKAVRSRRNKTKDDNLRRLKKLKA